MDLIAIIGVSLAAAVVAIILRQYRAEYAIVISLVTGAIVLVAIMQALEPVLGEVSELIGASGMGTENTAAILKVVGVGFITQLACDSCRDAGEGAIAAKVELAGRVSILILALPVFSQILQIVSGLFNL